MSCSLPTLKSPYLKVPYLKDKNVSVASVTVYSKYLNCEKHWQLQLQPDHQVTVFPALSLSTHTGWKAAVPHLTPLPAAQRVSVLTHLVLKWF